MHSQAVLLTGINISEKLATPSPEWKKEQVSPKHWYFSTRLHGVTSQMTAIFWIFKDGLMNQQRQR
jgi:hypothetical protein